MPDFLEDAIPTEPETAPPPTSDRSETAPESVDWQAALAPRGNETRLGQALQKSIYQQRSAPLAGVIVITDGGLNAGVDVAPAVQLARNAHVGIHTIGMGSTRRPVNVAIAGLVVPPRAYPGDRFFVTGYVQADGLAGRTVTVELFSERTHRDSQPTERRSEGVQRITLGADGAVLPVKFEVQNSADEGTLLTGRRLFTFQIHAPEEDTNARDNRRQDVVEIVEQSTRVLLLAGGPTREYRFLRSLLHRDKNVLLDVLLQTARPGIVQDADRLLDEFPISPTEMEQYDSIVAFDFDWRELDESQIELLDDWVGRQAGGLVVVAGPVFTSQWVNDHRTRRKLTKIRSLYPVKFRTSFSDLVEVDDGRFERNEAFPLQFTREGLDAEFLWLEETPVESEQTWAAFEGVYGYFSVADHKPGATVYAHFGDPDVAADLGKPIYLAEQFYGAGRVFYLGSGEFWRLRAVDESYFERFYTKLVRHVSQGRLMRGSRRGVLVVSHDITVVGKTIDVRANLTDARQNPLTIDRVDLQVVPPDGVPRTLALDRNRGRDGLYEGQLTLLQEGLYRLELKVPGEEEELLTQSIDVRIPNLEREHSVRNDSLLQEIAENTGGRHFVGLADPGEAGTARASRARALAGLLPDATEISFEPGVLDRSWEEKWMRWMMVLVCGALCMEWLVRRLLKLA